MTASPVTSAGLVEVTSTMGDMAADSLPLPEFVERVVALQDMSRTEAIRAAAELSDVALATLQAYADLCAWEESRERPNAEVAAETGIALSTLETRITRHNNRR